MSHCGEQVKELEVSEFKNVRIGKCLRMSCFCKTKSCLVRALKKVGNKLYLYSKVNLELDGSGQLHATTAVFPEKKLSFPKG
jgi:hypothetical protein